MGLSDATIHKIMDSCDIVDVIGGYLALTKKGNSYVGLCPFHDDRNPSMSVSRDKKIFNCFSCGTKGNVISFVSKYDNLTMEQAALKLAGKYGLDIDIKIDPEEAKKERYYLVMEEASKFYQFYLHNSSEGQIALKYLEGRGIDEELIRHFQIGLAPSGRNYLYQALAKKDIPVIDQIDLGLVRQGDDYYDLFRHRIMFPIQNPQGRTVAFSGRIYEGKSDEPKYINSIENPLFHKSEVLYNFHHASNAARQLNRIYIFEGFMDVIAGVKAGINNSVAAMGTALTMDHIRELSSVTKNIVLCFDGDSAGILATKRAIPLLNSAKIAPQTVTLPDDLDPDEYLDKYGKEALVSFLSQNTVSAYEFLYNEAKKNLMTDDINSVEQFKKEVFGFIRLAKSQLVTDFYLKKLASDLNTGIEVLAQDFGRTTYLGPVREAETEVRPPKITNRMLPKKISLALRVIIKNAMMSRDYFLEYYHKSSGFYESEIQKYFNLIIKIEEYYKQHDTFDYDEFKGTLGSEQELIDSLESIKDDEMLKEGGRKQFEDCVKQITDFMNFQKTQRLIKDAREDITKAPEMLKEVKKTKNILKEE
jgi:DNA primase